MAGVIARAYNGGTGEEPLELVVIQGKSPWSWWWSRGRALGDGGVRDEAPWSCMKPLFLYNLSIRLAFSQVLLSYFMTDTYFYFIGGGRTAYNQLFQFLEVIIRRITAYTLDYTTGAPHTLTTDCLAVNNCELQIGPTRERENNHSGQLFQHSYTVDDTGILKSNFLIYKAISFIYSSIIMLSLINDHTVDSAFQNSHTYV